MDNLFDDDLVSLGTQVQRVLAESSKRLNDLASAELNDSERSSLEDLKSLMSDGLRSVFSRKRTPRTKDALLALVRATIDFGPSSVLNVGSQRGGDFLQNQLRGRWAEDVCRSIVWDQHIIVEYGPSGSAMPGEEEHEPIVRSFREIVLTEGKRPDLICFDRVTWSSLPEAVRDNAATWPLRRITTAETDAIKRCTCGIEVKTSAWHQQQRTKHGDGALSITVKAEEVSEIKRWFGLTGRPVLFFQVLFDSVYCMSFLRMCEAIEQGYVYDCGDYVFGKDRKHNKPYHRFVITTDRHRCADTVFPNESKAKLAVLPSGNVIPYIRFAPASTSNARPEVIERELAYGRED